MKNYTKILCIFLTIIIAASCFATAGAAENENKENRIYFDTTGWKNFGTIYCHIWEVGGQPFYGWQARKEICDKETDTIYSYDLSNLNDSEKINGGLKAKKNYCVIFTANTGVQTFDTTIGKDCIGDTAYMTGKMIENSVDSERKANESVWTTNKKKYGPHLTVSSVGNIIGTHLCPNESKESALANWLSMYYQSSLIDVTETLAKIMPKLGVEDLSKLYFSLGEQGVKDQEVYDIAKKAEALAYGKFTLKKKSVALYIGDSYKICVIKGKRKQKPIFKTNSATIVKCSKGGKITAKKAGSTAVTVILAGLSRTLKVKVIKPSITIPKKINLPVYAKKKFPVLVDPEKGGKISWTSSNPWILTVSKSGKVVAKNSGSAVITAKLKYKGKTYKCKCKANVKFINNVRELIEFQND